MGKLKNAGLWLAISIAAVAAWVFSIKMMPALLPDDPNIMWRALIVKSTNTLLGVIALTGTLLFVNAVTKDDWLAKIYENAIACAVVVGVILYCAAWIFTYG